MAAKGRRLTIDDLTALHWVADPQISPDGTRIAFTRTWVDAEADEYRTAVWILAADGTGLRRLTAGEHDSQPRWSPNGSRLAFMRASEAGKPGQVCVLAMEGGDASPLTKLEKGVSDPAWSADGRRIAFRSRTNPALDGPNAKQPKHEPGRLLTQPVWRWNDEGFIDPDHLPHLWVIDAAGGAPRQLTRGRFSEAAPRWSGDGRFLVFLSDRRDQPWFGRDQQWLYRVPVDLDTPTDGARLEALTPIDGTVTGFRVGTDDRIAMTGCLYGERVLSYDQPGLMLGGPASKSAGTKAELPVRRIAERMDFPFGEGLAADQDPPRGGGDAPLGFSA